MTDFSHLYGIGKGEAQVLSIGPDVIKTYANQLALQDANKAKEREAYAKELEGVEWTSRNPEEEKHFRDQWENVLIKYHQRNQSNSSAEKIKLGAEINMIKKQMLSDGKRLKDEIDLDQKIAAMPLSHNEDELQDNFGRLLQERRATSVFNPNFANYGTDKFAVQPKQFDVNKDILNAANIAATEVNKEITIGSGIDAKRGWQEGKLLDEQKFKNLILNRISTNPSARRAYLKGAEPTEENLELATTAALETVKGKFTLKTREGGYLNPSGRDLFLSEKRAQISDRHEKPDDKNDLTYRQQLISRIFQGDKESLAEIRSYLPSGSTLQLYTSDQTAKSKGGYSGLRLHIPYRYYDGQMVPEVKEDVSFSLGDPFNKINSLLNTYTGEHINPSRLNTVGGKLRGPNFHVKPSVVKSSDKNPVMFSVNGKQYNIPADKVGAFIKQFPNAKKTIKGWDDPDKRFNVDEYMKKKGLKK